MRHWPGYLLLALLAVLPSACSHDRRPVAALEPSNPPDTGLALQRRLQALLDSVDVGHSPPAGCTFDSLGTLACPDPKPPGAP